MVLLKPWKALEALKRLVSWPPLFSQLLLRRIKELSKNPHGWGTAKGTDRANKSRRRRRDLERHQRQWVAPAMVDAATDSPNAPEPERGGERRRGKELGLVVASGLNRSRPPSEPPGCNRLGSTVVL